MMTLQLQCPACPMHLALIMDPHIARKTTRRCWGIGEKIYEENKEGAQTSGSYKGYVAAMSDASAFFSNLRPNWSQSIPTATLILAKDHLFCFWSWLTWLRDVYLWAGWYNSIFQQAFQKLGSLVKKQLRKSEQHLLQIPTTFPAQLWFRQFPKKSEGTTRIKTSYSLSRPKNTNKQQTALCSPTNSLSLSLARLFLSHTKIS